MTLKNQIIAAQAQLAAATTAIPVNTIAVNAINAQILALNGKLTQATT